jgi:ribosomal protein L11 methyltransferase
MSRSWPALDVRFTAATAGERAAAADRLSAALDDLHATAIEERDGGWRVFFATGPNRDAAGRALADGVLGAEPTAIDVADEDWARRSQEALGAVRVGRVVVAPPWLGAGAATEAGDLVVTILPSMGFGTGHHETTRLCLALLQACGPAGRRVLDVGTGSGVLALAAWRLGAGSILAVDDDGDAVAAAGENLGLNGAIGAVTLRPGDFRLMTGLDADIVLANLTGALLVRQAGTLAAAVTAGGSLIVSGLTLGEEEAVAGAFRPWLSPAKRLAEGEWVGLQFDRPAS